MMMSNLPPPSYFSNQVVPGVTIVNQAPVASSAFPISYKRVPVLVISILKCIGGILQIAVGIANVLYVPFYAFYASNIGVPIWFGVLIIVNGIFGCCSYEKPTKCMIGSFFGLSITSLLVSFIMLVFYTIYLDPYIHKRYLKYSFGRRNIIYFDNNVIIGLIGFLVFLIVVELCLSVSAIIFSCKAYSKFCNTCNCQDSGTCVGCREYNEGTAPYMGSEQQSPTGLSSVCNAQVGQQISSTLQAQQSTSPCSTLFNVIINFPGVSGAFNAAAVPNIATTEPPTIQVTVQDDNVRDTSLA